MSEWQLIPVSMYYFLFVLIYTGALKDTLGLKLVGPFEILAGAHKISKNPQPNFHLHWRYFYDPPEFQTILLGNEASQHHIGYYRYRAQNLFRICDVLDMWSPISFYYNTSAGEP